MVDNLRFFAGAARCMEGKAAGEYLEGYTSIIRREPVGVVGQIAPWNYPLMMAVWKIGPALAAGYTIVLKPAPTTPLTTLRCRRARGRDPAQGRAERRSPAATTPAPRSSSTTSVDMVSLTGSVETGKWIAEHAAKTLKRVHLELGGKAPVIVFDDVDLDTVLETSPAPATTTPARTAPRRRACSPSGKVYDDVVNGLAEQAKGYVMGDLRSPDTNLGPLNSPASASASRASSSARRRTRRS
jgi:betaine-aldehyde dehydrogenase